MVYSIVTYFVGGVFLKNLLQERIEEVREAMIQTAHQKGLQSIETVELSRQLDVLMNEYEASLRKDCIKVNYKKKLS